jgi:glycosyltransferase involved in cell wall biosynthesis
VASAIGDITQYLQDQENALLCRAGDSHSLADALERMMQNRALREKVSLNARQTAEKYFDCRIIARQVESALLR